MALDVNIEGCEKLSKLLQSLPNTIAKKILRKGMRKGAKLLMEQAKQNVPVDSGNLKKNIKVKALPRSRNFLGVDVIVGDKWNTGKAFYGAFIEFGTTINKYNSSISAHYGNQRIRPRNFIKNAYQSKGMKSKYTTIVEIQELTQETIKEQGLN